MQFYPLEKLHNLVDGYRSTFQISGRTLLLMQLDGERLLIDNRCPHAGHPLLESTIESGNIRCPLHGINFSLQSGKALNVENFPADKCLKFFQPVYEENTLGVML